MRIGRNGERAASVNHYYKDARMADNCICRLFISPRKAQQSSKSRIHHSFVVEIKVSSCELAMGGTKRRKYLNGEMWFC